MPRQQCDLASGGTLGAAPCKAPAVLAHLWPTWHLQGPNLPRSERRYPLGLSRPPSIPEYVSPKTLEFWVDPSFPDALSCCVSPCEDDIHKSGPIVTQTPSGESNRTSRCVFDSSSLHPGRGVSLLLGPSASTQPSISALLGKKIIAFCLTWPPLPAQAQVLSSRTLALPGCSQAQAVGL